MSNITKETIIKEIDRKLKLNFGLDRSEANPSIMLNACILVIRNLMSGNSVSSRERQHDDRQVHYLSLEFLIGRSLEKNAFNLGILDELKEALEEMGYSASDIFEEEPDAGLGNGGLGRLAACYLESMATLNIPATGYSICYELGIFKQKIVDGEQVELTDDWLVKGDSWLMREIDDTVEVHFGGQVQSGWGENGTHYVSHTGYTTVLAVPRDILIAGYETDRANKLRLWDAKSPDSMDMSLFSKGEYMKAMENRAMAEVITKVLYPEDNHIEGKSLRLKQQYFFVSATAQSIIKRHRATYSTVRNFHEKHILQINDTHPSLVIPELMRIFMDEDGLGWDDAWHIVTNSVAYTNHTVMSEALESWPQYLFERFLPRIWSILREINDRYCRKLTQSFGGDIIKVGQMAIIWDFQVRMANLCICACCSVNGVSGLHSEILKNDIFRYAYKLNPGKFKNVTNGIDHRRWLGQANPELHKLVIDLISDSYLKKPQELRKLEHFSQDKSVLDRLGNTKRLNKERLADWVYNTSGISLNTDAVFDVQVKRLHEYKRQLMNAMHICHLYLTLRDNPKMDFLPRTFVFGAKAAPGYAVAKQIIKLICELSDEIMSDPVCKDKLQMVFLENYRVSMAEILMPATEVSEQISTAGMEASGTGNMKFMMNGALTVGTLDGANVEMHEVLGEENMFLFGLRVEQVRRLKNEGYNPSQYYNSDPNIRRVLDHLSNCLGGQSKFSDLVSGLLFGGRGEPDPYMLIADFDSYRRAHERIAETYPDKLAWNRMSLLNIAKSGIFAADRSIREYSDKIWHVPYGDM